MTCLSEQDAGIPDQYNWESLKIRKGEDLESHYIALLRALGKQKGMIGQIFVKSQNQIQDPAKLYKIIHMIDAENWIMMGADVKGDIYEGLLEKNAKDVKSGAGQYFTPRPLIRAMVECVRPAPSKTIADPACGKKSSITITNGSGRQEKEDLRYNRQDFWATTANKQLNFVQHVRTMLNITGLAAVVVPGNVLFEGGAGVDSFKQIMESINGR